MSESYPNTCGVRSNIVQEWRHVLALSDAALQARIESISREEGEEFWLAIEAFVVTVMVT